MTYKYDQSFNRCVLIDAPRLERLITDLGLDGQKLTIDLECADAIKRSYTSIEALRAFQNDRNQSIRELHLRLGEYYAKESFHITFRTSFLLESVKCEAASTDEATMGRYRQVIDSFFDRNAPWWAVFGRIDYASWRSFVVLTLVAILAAWWFQRWSMATFIPMLPMGCGWLLAVTVPRVFPRSNYLFGSGEARFQRAEVWRIVVLVGFAISLLASIVATELYKPR